MSKVVVTCKITKKTLWPSSAAGRRRKKSSFAARDRARLRRRKIISHVTIRQKRWKTF